jgi:alanyl-tRNA synthetase
VTSRIYYTDPYCRRFDATVTKALEHDRRPAVVLDRTAFYPTSGGQPFDTGRLDVQVRPDDGGPDDMRRGPSRSAVTVVETIDVDDEIVHVLSAPLAAGAAVRAEIDWDRRFDHMQQHTGQHVLSAAFDRLFENRTSSFHMGAEIATIDLAREMSWEQIARAEDESNRIIWSDRDVSIRFVSAAEAAALPLRKEPAREGPLRLIEVDHFDLSACGGTHVARTGAIGAIVVAGAEKFKGGTRITFACGGRALRVFRMLRESVGGSVRVLSVLPHELPASIERMQAEAKDLRKFVNRLQETLAGHEASRLISRWTGPFGPGDHPGGAAAALIVVEALEGWDPGGLKAIASAITASTSAAVALFSTTSPFAVVIARSPDARVDANAVLRGLTEKFGGRGGGRPDLAQGGGLAGDIRQIASDARRLLES